MTGSQIRSSSSGRLLAGALTGFLLFAAVALAGPVAAQDNSAVAINLKDGKSVFKLAFSVRRVSGELDAENTAVAFASCTDCRTVAAAIQVVLVTDPTSVEAENLALSVNYQCSECETLAAAYQFVFGTGEDLVFSQEAKKQLHDLKKRMQDLRDRDLSLRQLAEELSLIAGDVAKVIDTGLVARKDENDAGATSTTSSTDASGATEPDETTTTSSSLTSTTDAPSASKASEETTTSSTPPLTTSSRP